KCNVISSQTAVGTRVSAGKTLDRHIYSGISGAKEFSELTATEDKVHFQKNRTPETNYESHTISFGAFE
ncbi:hypothetical protein NXF25_009715, partial [Crotalus adamanteus]